MIDVNQIYFDNINFTLKSFPIKVSNDLIQEFNESFRILERSNNNLIIRLEHGKICKKRVEEIFICLKSESLDKYELEFYKELANLVQSFLDEYIEWIASKKNTEKKVETCEISEEFTKNLYLIGAIQHEELTLILNSLSTPIEELRRRIKIGEWRREKLTISSNFYLGTTLRILNKIFERDGLNSVVSSYMAREYKVGGAALEVSPKNAGWWFSNGGNQLISQAAYAHLDESITKPKAILYLTDVGELNGPTSYYPGLYEKLRLTPLQEIIGRVIGHLGSAHDSILADYYDRKGSYISSSREFRYHFMRLPGELRFNSHLGWDIAPGTAAEEEFIELEKKMTGQAGTYIIFDGGRLFHRGGLVNSGDRIALQIIFEENSFKANLSKKIRSINSKIKKLI